MNIRKKNILCMVFVIFILNISIVSTVSAVVLDIGEITSDPANPAPKSTATFSVDIGVETPSEVWLIVEECNGNTGVCYTDIQNVSMNESAGLYQTSVTLRHDDATYITCKVLAKSDGSWLNSSKKIDLSEEPDGTQNGNGDTDNKTPGFELVLFLLAVALGMLLFRRKRSR
ncbi:MAG: hypothetical protein NTV74_02245 [Euryarchaeota archaeon]|nr:hypothetical protein [Euryarchaeota archaeon]